MSRIIKTSFADDGDDRTLGRLADALEQREPELRKVIGQPENPDVTPALNDGQEWISNLPAMPAVPGPNQKTAMFMQAPDLSVVLRGGPGSGHFGHAGRPGKIGGSQPSDFHEAKGGPADEDIPALAEAEYQATALGFEKHLLEKYGEAEPRRATWIGPSGKFLVQDGDHQRTAIELMGWESPSDPKEGEPITKEWENRGFKATNEVVAAGLIRFNLGQFFGFNINIITFDIPSDGKVTEDQRIAMATLVEGEAALDGSWPNLKIGIGGPFTFEDESGNKVYNLQEIKDDEASYDFIGLDRPTGLRSYVRPVERGGPGSGHFGHKGIPEHRGGSQPGDFHSGEGEKAGEKKRVGITSSRPGKPNAQVFEEMRQFKDRLLALPTVANAEVEPGLGGWQDESGQIVREPTWVVSYEGNGEAQALLEETAKLYEQDAVLVMGGTDGEDAPMSRIVFGDNVTPEERDAIQTSAAKHGFAGWTWYRDEQGRAVMELVTVPQWGGDVGKHVLKAVALSNDIRAIGQPSEISNQSVKVSVVETRKTLEPPDLPAWAQRVHRGGRGSGHSVVGMTRRLVVRGGPGSGHFGHSGRPGEVGGSTPSDFHSAQKRRSYPDDMQETRRRIESLGGTVAWSKDDLDKLWDRNAERRMESRLSDFKPEDREYWRGHFEDRLAKEIRTDKGRDQMTIAFDASGGRLMSERQVRAYLDAYEGLLQDGAFAKNPMALILTPTPTEEELDAFVEKHPRRGAFAKSELNDGAAGKYLSYMRGFWAFDYPDIFGVSGEKWWDEEHKAGPSAWESTERAAAISLYSPRETGVLLHEYGHHLSSDDRFPSAWKASQQLLSTGSGDISAKNAHERPVSENISFYATTNRQELVAECYAMSRHPDYEAKATPDQREIINFVLNGGPAPSYLEGEE